MKAGQRKECCAEQVSLRSNILCDQAGVLERLTEYKYGAQDDGRAQPHTKGSVMSRGQATFCQPQRAATREQAEREDQRPRRVEAVACARAMNHRSVIVNVGGNQKREEYGFRRKED